MKLYTTQPVWRYAIFQISAVLTVLFLLLALLTSQLRWFTSPLSVYISIDLSASTYEKDLSQFKNPETAMKQEIDAVKAYVERNASLASPNLIYLSGFAEQIVPITESFSEDEEIALSIERAIQPSIVETIGEGTNVGLAIEHGLSQLNQQTQNCRQMLLITDGNFPLDQEWVSLANDQEVKLNFLLASQSITSDISALAKATGGVALAASSDDVSDLLEFQIFNRFTSSRFVSLFLGLAWIFLMWMLLLPIDRFLHYQANIRVDYSGRIALFNAVFWSLISPLFLIMLGFNPWQHC